MRAAVYDRFGGPIELRTVPDPAVLPGEVVVAVLAVGLCRSDLHGWRGTDPDIVCPHVGGHEFVGEVVAVGEGVDHVTAGEVVVAPFVCGCGRCEPCRLGQPQVCRRQEQPGFTRWGAFADYVAVPYAAINVVPVPSGVSLELAALVGCRVSTAYRGVVERGRVLAGEVLVVHGCGGVGLAAVALGTAVGAEVVAVDVDERALALASHLGARHTMLATTPTATASAIVSLTGGAHVALDCLGGAAVAVQSLLCLRPLGRHVQIGLFPAPTAELPIGRVVREELELLGVHGLGAGRFPAVFELVQEGRLDLAPLVSQRIALDDLPQALPAMAGFTTPGVTVVTRGLAGVAGSAG
jgi:alcohol dehydrogenase